MATLFLPLATLLAVIALVIYCNTLLYVGLDNIIVKLNNIIESLFPLRLSYRFSLIFNIEYIYTYNLYFENDIRLKAFINLINK